MTRQIFVNGRFLTQPLTGVQRYAREILYAWDEMNPDAEIVCLAPPEEFVAPEWKNIRLQVVGRNHGNVWEQVDLTLWLKGRLLFSPGNVGPAFYSNQIVTMHDAAVFAIPEAYSRAFRMKYWFLLGQLAKRVRRIITVSEFSRRELARYLKCNPERFTVIYNGGDHILRAQADESILDRYGLRGQKYLLTVGSQSPHKNVARLLDAVNPLRGSMMRLVVAGGRDRSVFQDGSVAARESVVALGHVDDASLKALYSHAFGFILPSLYEGFGLPVLEAMNCGCPVLCSHAASLPEVGGDAALYFDPRDVSDITAAIQKFIDDEALRTHLRQHAMEQARQFTWRKTAQHTLNVLLASAN